METRYGWDIEALSEETERDRYPHPKSQAPSTDPYPRFTVGEADGGLCQDLSG